MNKRLNPVGRAASRSERQGDHGLAGSQNRQRELEQAWARKRVIYQQQLERRGEEIEQAQLYLRVMEQHPQHFQRVWEREDRIARQARQQQREQRRSRERERDRGGWSR